MMTYETEVADLQAQPAAAVRSRISLAEIPTFLGSAFGEVMRALSVQGLAPAGPPFARYDPSNGGFEIEAGFPATGVVAPTGRVVACELPGGPVARVLYKGDYAGVAAAYEAASTWITAHGYVPAGPPWESYLDPPEVAEPRTLVSIPCRPR